MVIIFTINVVINIILCHGPETFSMYIHPVSHIFLLFLLVLTGLVKYLVGDTHCILWKLKESVCKKEANLGIAHSKTCICIISHNQKLLEN